MFARALLVPAFVALLFAPAPRAQDAAAPRHLAVVRTSGPAEMDRLLALDLDLAACRTPLPAQRRVELIVDDAELALLETRGFDVRVLQRDLAAHYEARALAAMPPGGYLDDPNPPLGQGAMGGHWTFAQMEAILDQLHAANPAICAAKVSIGSSLENRPLWMVKISDNVAVDENEPELLFDALHHAREPLSMETTLVFMDWLVTNYGTDPDATLIVDERELFFVPCVNPDGYVYNETTNPNGGGLWRKNRRLNPDNTRGVDLNRNYATQWLAPNGGSSTTPSAETYRGTAPFSEPETTAMEAFAQSRSFVTVFSTHTYADILLRPWCWEINDPPNAGDYDELGDWYTVENGMPHGRWSTLLYISGGTSVDQHHTVRGSFSWTAELGRSSEGGFWPFGQNITNVALRYQPMFRKVALSAGAAFDLVDHFVVEGAGSNGNQRIDPGETGYVVSTVRNRGLLGAAVTVQLQAVTPGVTIGTGTVALGNAASFQNVSHNGMPLTFSTPSTFALPVITLRLVVSGDGRSQEQLVTVPLQSERPVLTDDFELDHGFARDPAGTATTGLWERAAPMATTNGATPIQPGSQTTPGGTLCWVTDGRAGASAGTYDVDGGHTDLLSPVMDLRHLAAARLTLELWYAESTGDDAMAIDVSRDGGANWSTLYSRTTSTAAWVPLELDLGLPLTDRMRLRVRAQDQNPSLVECLVDDLAIAGFPAHGSITALGSGAPSSNVQIAMHGAPGELLFALVAFGAGPGATFPGVTGTLLLDLATVLALPLRIADADGRGALEVALPPGGFAGVELHWQTAVLGSAAAAFGGNTAVIVLQ
ncbi:MAG: zinc carboxypeptidase [Planctomycetes bacterium]|nr:zinc carboxypeptidase [Planctomycetota bacterium]